MHTRKAQNFACFHNGCCKRYFIHIRKASHYRQKSQRAAYKVKMKGCVFYFQLSYDEFIKRIDIKHLHKKKKYEAELQMNLMKGFLMDWEKFAQGQTT